jgi:hypothetical protein
LAFSSAMRFCASFSRSRFSFSSAFFCAVLKLRGDLCGRRPVSQLIFASTASESVVVALHAIDATRSSLLAE